jgi:hypothetical protein
VKRRLDKIRKAGGDEKSENCSETAGRAESLKLLRALSEQFSDFHPLLLFS